MDYAVIILLSITVVLLIILLVLTLVKKGSDGDVTLKLGKFEADLVKEIGDFKYEFSKSLQADFKELNENLEKRLNLINDKVNERLDVNFEKTNKTFTSLLERLTKIDEAQKKIDGLSNDILGLQAVLTDKKTRGIFGETTLNYILDSIFGKNDQIYKEQYTLSNGTIADAILFAPAPLGTIAIDSKFPLEHYQIMTNPKLDKLSREAAAKSFKTDVKRHIDAIKTKYIIEGETAGEAIMFLPAEAIFAEINAYHPDLIEYSYKAKVWITSPTTLMSTLTIIGMILKNMERDKYAKVIHDELNKLSSEFDRYRERWDKLSRSINTVSKDALDIHTTTEKISKRFASISNVNPELKGLRDAEEIKEDVLV